MAAMKDKYLQEVTPRSWDSTSTAGVSLTELASLRWDHISAAIRAAVNAHTNVDMEDDWLHLATRVLQQTMEDHTDTTLEVKPM